MDDAEPALEVVQQYTLL